MASLLRLWMFGFLLLSLAQSSFAQIFSKSTLPIVLINTNGQEIIDDPKIAATMKIIHNPAKPFNEITDPANVYDGLIGIELRGQSSQGYPKKPYGLETRTADGENNNVSLLGMPEENDWALIAPFNDKTMMRDALTYELARKTMKWAPRFRYVEVQLNGEYVGVYMLIETVKRDRGRVAIKNLEPGDVSADKRTGGYILKMDKYGAGEVGGNFQSIYPPIPGSWQRTYFQYHFPKEDEIVSQQEQYIQTYMFQFEAMMAGPNFATEFENWIDIDSWVDYFLVQEIAKNTDGYRLSAYFYKDRDDVSKKIFMGPVWDFNISFGIGDYCQGQPPTGWARDFNQICPDDAWVIHFWWDKLWNNPKFRQRISERWTALRNQQWTTEKIYGTVDSLAGSFAEARGRNFERWPIFGTYVWPNAFIGQNYGEELDYLKTWIEQRLDWMDGQLLLGTSTSTPDSRKDISVSLQGERLMLQATDLEGSQQVEIIDAMGHVLLRQRILFSDGRAEVQFSGNSTGLLLLRVNHHGYRPLFFMATP